ncbi:RcnB family protein [Novosphingobium sp. TH158]|uniref:RcnB family protein n=1 Tax=Novosphingobium sp. TH158 TaxID=2067455 RepID=UPI0020B177EC|nr:RcnB family protein [Novosphingobium sp. TH158]
MVAAKGRGAGSGVTAMAVKQFMKTSGLAALAASMSLFALPASADAQEGGWGRRSGEAAGTIGSSNSEGRRGSWSGGSGNSRSWGQRQQSAPQAQVPVQAQAQVQAAPAAPAQRSWNGGGNRGSWNGGATAGAGEYRRQWTPRAQPAPQAQAQTQAQVQTQAPAAGSWNGRSTWQQRRSGNGGQATTTTTPQAPVAQGQWGGRNSDARDRDRRNDNWTAQTRQTRPSWEGRRQDDRNWRDNDRDRRDNRWTDRNSGSNDRWRNHNNTQRWGYSGDYRRWNRDWRRDNRYNWYSWRNSNRDVFRWGYYNPPYRNYSYRRLSVGFFLDSLFFGSNYWINDPWQYRLPDAYGPYRWIRYYDDALLVDIYSGEVVDVIHNFFW